MSLEVIDTKVTKITLMGVVISFFLLKNRNRYLIYVRNKTASYEFDVAVGVLIVYKYVIRVQKFWQ